MQIRVCILIEQSSYATCTIITRSMGVVTPYIIVATLICSKSNLCCLTCGVDSCNLLHQNLGEVDKLAKSAKLLFLLLVGKSVKVGTTATIESAILNIIALATIGNLNIQKVGTALEGVGFCALAHLEVGNVYTLGDSV